MTREEEIRQAARKYFDDYIDGLKGEVLTVEQTFEDAAKWADEHPNPNTIKKIFEFALEKTNFLIADNLESIDWGVLIKKAMEE